MAYTRIHAIKSTLNKALDYIENPDKTQEQILVSGYNVDPLSASIEYAMTAALAKEIKGDYESTGGGNNLAYHMIQSFSPYDKINSNEAHALGKKWANEILQGKYEYVISTHVDKGHIHNHIIFNAVSFYDYKKYETKPYKTAGLLRSVSDKLCEEQGLHVIENPNLKQKSATYFEWEQKKAGSSWKVQIKNIIDKAINENTDYASFKAALTQANIEVKEGKRISFRMVGTDQERYCRGDRIGEEYSKEKIIERLAVPKEKTREKILPLKQEEKEKTPVYQEKQQTFKSYDKKVEWEAQKTQIANTKELAAALLTIRTEGIEKESDFSVKIETLSVKAGEVRNNMNELSDKNKQYKDAAKYLLAFNQFSPIKQKYEKQTIFTKNKYAAGHESELRAFDHAAAQLEKLGINTNVDPDKVFQLVKTQDTKVNELSEALKGITGRIETIRKAQQLVNNIKKDTVPDELKKKEKDISL